MDIWLIVAIFNIIWSYMESYIYILFPEILDSIHWNSWNCNLYIWFYDYIYIYIGIAIYHYNMANCFNIMNPIYGPKSHLLPFHPRPPSEAGAELVPEILLDNKGELELRGGVKQRTCFSVSRVWNVAVLCGDGGGDFRPESCALIWLTFFF